MDEIENAKDLRIDLRRAQDMIAMMKREHAEEIAEARGNKFVRPARTKPMTLAYWDIRGLAQPIRLLLEYVGEPYEDKRYVQGPGPGFDKSCWTQVKDSILGPEYPFPNLPYLQDGDTVVTQSNAIVRYIAREHHLLGNTKEQCRRVDVMLEEAMDFRNRTVTMAYGRLGLGYAKEIHNYTQTLHQNLTKYSKFLGAWDWFAGESISCVDFVMFELLDQNSLMVKGCLSEYTNLEAFVARVAGLSAIAKFIQKTEALPCNNKHSYTSINGIC